MYTGPSCSAAAATAAASSVESAGSRTVIPRQRAHQREIVDRLVCRPERRRDPGQERDDDAAARPGGEGHGDLVIGAAGGEDAVGDCERQSPVFARPPATPIMFASAIPIWKNRSG
jgi:hypothetical protein